MLKIIHKFEFYLYQKNVFRSEVSVGLPKRLFGFLQDRTTEQADIYLTSIITMELDNRYKVATVFLDIIKAFDTVSHDSL